jgi:alcohol dehydrogenase class IV
MLIAVGAGSALKAARIVAILLAETRPIEQLITQYPPGGRAVSPKLLAPKLPIINVLTAPTTAQNRAGAALKESVSGQRMEFFDPKTRPCAVFWDAEALLTAPASLALNTGAAVYWRSLMNMGLAASANPLVEGERHQAFRLANNAILHVTEAENAEARIDLCAAAFLQNREEDEGKRLADAHWAARVVYALGASTFHLCEHVAQGAAYAALTGTAVRHFGARNADAMLAMGRALGLDGELGVARVADAFDKTFAALGLLRRLRDLGVPRERLPAILGHSLQNFNADANREFLNETDLLERVLNDSW